MVDGGREGTSALGAQASGTQVRALRFGWLNGALYREPRLLKTIGASLFWSHLPGNSLESQVLPPKQENSGSARERKDFQFSPGWVALFVFALPDPGLCPELSRADSDKTTSLSTGIKNCPLRPCLPRVPLITGELELPPHLCLEDDATL